MPTYHIHDNGGKPFKVVVDNKNKIATIYKQDMAIEDDFAYEPKQSMKIKFIKIFVGNSPRTKMTEISGGFGPIFNGNSLLLLIKKDTYIFIGYKISQFIYDIPIVKYVSPVGRSDVPYPYAVDRDNNLIHFSNPKIEKYDYVKYDKKRFDCPIEFIYFRFWFHNSPKSYPHFKLYDKYDKVYNFKFYANKFYIDGEIVSKKLFIDTVDKLLPKLRIIKHKTLIKRL